MGIKMYVVDLDEDSGFHEVDEDGLQMLVDKLRSKRDKAGACLRVTEAKLAEALQLLEECRWRSGDRKSP